MAAVRLVKQRFNRRVHQVAGRDVTNVYVSIAELVKLVGCPHCGVEHRGTDRPAFDQLMGLVRTAKRTSAP